MFLGHFQAVDMNKAHPDRPEHCPQGYEWLPDAVRRDVEPHGPDALERVRQALAEGDILAKLRIPLGYRYDIDPHIWDKEPVRRKVNPRFTDGWMRIGLNPDSGPYKKGWVFVPIGSLAAILEKAPSTTDRPRSFSQAQLERCYKDHIKECEGAGKMPSRDDDLQAVREALSKDIPRDAVRELRHRFAPDQWKKGGRRPGKPGGK